MRMKSAGNLANSARIGATRGKTSGWILKSRSIPAANIPTRPAGFSVRTRLASALDSASLAAWTGDSATGATGTAGATGSGTGAGRVVGISTPGPGITATGSVVGVCGRVVGAVVTV